MTELLYVIWSVVHHAWRGDRGLSGYCLLLKDAGRFTHAEATTLVRRANSTQDPEVMIPTWAFDESQAPPAEDPRR